MQERDLRSLDPLSQRRGPLPEVRGVVRPGFAESREWRRHPQEGKCRRAAQGAEVQPAAWVEPWISRAVPLEVQTGEFLESGPV